MSNEAFEKWAINYGLDYEPSFTRDDVEAAWQAAKAMCEQSEPVAWTDEHRNFLEWDKDSLIDKSCCKDTEAIPLFTSPQKPQPLKRLSDKAIGDCLNKAELPTIMLNPIVVEKLDNFANAIMDEMERINK